MNTLQSGLVHSNVSIELDRLRRENARLCAGLVAKRMLLQVCEDEIRRLEIKLARFERGHP